MNIFQKKIDKKFGFLKIELLQLSNSELTIIQ